MNEEQLILVGLLGASAIAGAGLVLARDAIESPSEWYEVSWPRDLDPDNVAAFWRHLAGDRSRHVIALEVIAHSGHLVFRLGIAETHADAVLAELDSYLPGTVAKLIEHDVVCAPHAAWRLVLSARQRPLRTADPEHVARALTTALANAGPTHTVIYQCLLGPRLSPTSAPAKGGAPAQASWSALLTSSVSSPQQLNNEARRAILEKVGEPGFRTLCRVGVDAADAQTAQAIASRVLAALRTAEAPGVRITLKKDNPEKLASAEPPKRWPTALNVKELTSLCGWPLGRETYPGVSRTPARLLAAPDVVARRGRVVAVSTAPGPERPIALRLQDSLQHLHVLGPTGVGKSTLLLNLIVQDMHAGRSVVVVDPKGDLIEEVLRRVPAERSDDVIVLDPADEQRPVGLNVLADRNQPPELIADQVLSVFHDLYRENWGPRTQDILHAALLTLAGRPNATLCALPVLLSNARFRRQCVARLDDEVALKPFWAWYEGLTDGERQQAIAPVMNKLRAFLLRPRMRAVIGQAEPSLDLRAVFAEHRVLLVSLAKGVLGPEAATLLGSLIVSQLWQTALGRVRLPAAMRTPVMIYIDEFQDYLHLPTDVADVLAQARGLGVGLTLAHQHLAQLPPSLRAAVMANARSRVCFQLGHEDARLVAARHDEIDASDLQNLGRYDVYASLVADGRVIPFASGRTLAPEAPTSDSAAIRVRSRDRYGQDLSAIEKGLAALVTGGSDDEGPIGKRRRS